MSEQELAVEPYAVVYICDEMACGEEMTVDSGVNAELLLAKPPLYPHTCSNGHQQNLTEKYPTVRWRRFVAKEGEEE